MRKSELRNAKLEAMRKVKAKKEMAECTFKPALNKASRRTTRVEKKHVAEPGNTLFQRALVRGKHDV